MTSRAALTDKKLEESIHKAQESRPPLIEGFIHEGSVVMVSSDPGVGKSTITACWMAQASLGLPVFGHLFVPRPLLIYYVPFERGATEILERFKHIETAIPADYRNIFVNENFMGMNVINERHADEIIGTIRHDLAGRHLDILVLDPIYASVAGGLSSDEQATQFTRFSTRIQTEFKCANYLNHHTTKQTYDREGQAITKDDPFYGSQWLKAHCTAGYYMKRQGNSGPVLECKKDSHSVQVKRLALNYNPENYTVELMESAQDMSVTDRLIATHRTLKTTLKSVTFKELQGCLVGVSDSYLRHLLQTPPFSDAFEKRKSKGGATLYTPTGVL